MMKLIPLFAMFSFVQEHGEHEECHHRIERRPCAVFCADIYQILIEVGPLDTSCSEYDITP